jgi:hypothetical protein
MLVHLRSIARVTWGVILCIGILLHLAGALVYWRLHIALFGEEGSR